MDVRDLRQRASVYENTSRKQSPPALCAAPGQNYPSIGVMIRSLVVGNVFGTYVWIMATPQSPLELASCLPTQATRNIL